MGTGEPRRGADEPGARRMLRHAGPVLWGLLAVVVIGLVAGVVFSRTDPRHAARVLLGEQVRTEPEGEATSGPAPSSGKRAGGPTCGVAGSPVPVQAQIDALAAGVVVVQYRDEDHADALSQALADRSRLVLVAPNRDLDAAVVATAWGRRLRLDGADGHVLRAFVTAHAGIGPQVTDCNP